MWNWTTTSSWQGTSFKNYLNKRGSEIFIQSAIVITWASHSCRNPSNWGEPKLISVIVSGEKCFWQEKASENWCRVAFLCFCRVLRFFMVCWAALQIGATTCRRATSRNLNCAPHKLCWQTEIPWCNYCIVIIYYYIMIMYCSIMMVHYCIILIW